MYIHIQQLHIYYVCNLLCVEGSAVSRCQRDAPSASHPGRAARRGAGTARPCQPGRAAAVPALGSPPPRSRGRSGRRYRRAGCSAGAEGALDGESALSRPLSLPPLSPQAAARRGSWRPPRPPPPAAPPRAPGPARRCPRRRRRGWTCRAPSSGSASTRSAPR